MTIFKLRMLIFMFLCFSVQNCTLLAHKIDYKVSQEKTRESINITNILLAATALSFGMAGCAAYQSKLPYSEFAAAGFFAVSGIIAVFLPKKLHHYSIPLCNHFHLHFPSYSVPYGYSNPLMHNYYGPIIINDPVFALIHSITMSMQNNR